MITLADIKSNNLLDSATQVVYKVKPGKYYFYLDGGENDDMIQIDTAKNKIYYVEIAASIGFAITRFYFQPIKNGNSIYDIPDWTLIEPDEKAKKSYKDNLPEYLSEIKEDFPEWLKEEDKNEMQQKDGYPLKP